MDVVLGWINNSLIASNNRLNSKNAGPFVQTFVPSQNGYTAQVCATWGIPFYRIVDAHPDDVNNLPVGTYLWQKDQKSIFLDATAVQKNDAMKAALGALAQKTTSKCLKILPCDDATKVYCCSSYNKDDGPSPLLQIGIITGSLFLLMIIMTFLALRHGKFPKFGISFPGRLNSHLAR